MAYYLDFNEVDLIPLQGAIWYSTYDLLTEMRYLRAINFHIVEQRAQALERFNKLDGLFTDELFNLERRFPMGIAYVCDIMGEWPRRFQQLKTALSYKERDLRNQEKSSPDHQAQQNDAFVAFWNATTNIIDAVVKKDYWTTKLFERHFRLTWFVPQMAVLPHRQDVPPRRDAHLLRDVDHEDGLIPHRGVAPQRDDVNPTAPPPHEGEQ